jgi:hypothetical protein
VQFGAASGPPEIFGSDLLLSSSWLGTRAEETRRSRPTAIEQERVMVVLKSLHLVGQAACRSFQHDTKSGEARLLLFLPLSFSHISELLRGLTGAWQAKFSQT